MRSRTLGSGPHRMCAGARHDRIDLVSPWPKPKVRWRGRNEKRRCTPKKVSRSVRADGSENGKMGNLRCFLGIAVERLRLKAKGPA